MFSLLTIVPRLVISSESIKEAFDLCQEVDEKDTMYVALAIQLNIELITRDKALFNHLKGKGFDKVVMWNDIFDAQ